MLLNIYIASYKHLKGRVYILTVMQTQDVIEEKKLSKGKWLEKNSCKEKPKEKKKGCSILVTASLITTFP